ncbi:hypothetical protein FIA58_019820 [Flavobacterium jejuense]|uniref:Uncharacterized protein n=1 Tax=Flavobacterium jejuense TaxID=1544455 RepID=A0ABX0IVU0_9FLAO|nr:hypothetical protein [Flavobacterium jejuense]NHN27932.1 hypothetical protein [Flavobacterium jejuense]
MLKNIIQKFKKRRLYIQLYKNNVAIKDIDTQKNHQSVSEIPFNNDRLLIADFNKAVTFYKTTFKQLNLINFNTKALIHQKEMNKNGLSEVEIRVIEEVFERVGLKSIYISDLEKDLNDKEIENYFKIIQSKN